MPWGEFWTTLAKFCIAVPASVGTMAATAFGIVMGADALDRWMRRKGNGDG